MMRRDPVADRFDRERTSQRANAVRERLAVSAVVGRVVALKKSGTEFAGLCPFHDEKTPSFTVNDRKQFFHCFGCGQHGDVIGFVIRRQGLGFREALELLESQGGLRHLQAARPAPPAPKAEQREDLDKAQRIAALWAECRWDPTIARYLMGRAIVPPSTYGGCDAHVNDGWPADLLFHPALWHGLEKRRLPAMVAAMRPVPGGPIVALHRTYLRIEGAKVVKAGTESDKRMFGNIAGAAIWLSPVADRMVVGEGIETSLSAMQLFRRAGWAAGSAAALKSVDPPFEADDIIVAADWNAKNRTGERWAFKARAKWGIGRTVAVKVPDLRERPKADFNDVAQLLAVAPRHSAPPSRRLQVISP